MRIEFFGIILCGNLTTPAEQSHSVTEPFLMTTTNCVQAIYGSLFQTTVLEM